jgi:hypothetical protein
MTEVKLVFEDLHWAIVRMAHLINLDSLLYTLMSADDKYCRFLLFTELMTICQLEILGVETISLVLLGGNSVARRSMTGHQCTIGFPARLLTSWKLYILPEMVCAGSCEGSHDYCTD